MPPLSACLLPIVALLAQPASAQENPNPWDKVKDADRIQVYERDFPGSYIHELKIVMEVDASVDEIQALANDIPAFEDWVYKCVEARDLGDDPEGGYYYTRVDVPWPMDDRDLAVRVNGTVDESTGVYTSQSVAVPARVPEVEGVVRMTTYQVETTYEPRADGTGTTMTYVMHSEPGGSVPAWVSNLFLDKGPLTSMRRFRKLLESRKRVADD